MADVKISQLPVAGPLNPTTDLSVAVQSGVTCQVVPNNIVNPVLLSPGPIGSGSPNTANFTTLGATTANFTTINATTYTGLTNVFAAPPAIGNTTPNSGSFTGLVGQTCTLSNVNVTTSISGTGFTNSLKSPPAIGSTTPNVGQFTTLAGSTCNFGLTRFSGYPAGYVTLDSQGNMGIAGLGTMATQQASNVTITGGSIDGTNIGINTAGNAKFSSATVNNGLSILGGVSSGASLFVSSLFSNQLIQFTTAGGAQAALIRTLDPQPVSQTFVQMVVSSTGGMCLLQGTNGANSWVSLIFYGGNTALELADILVAGNPVQKTYQCINGSLQVKVASSTYSITPFSIAGS
jgi:hypothetical protein